MFRTESITVDGTAYALREMSAMEADLFYERAQTVTGNRQSALLVAFASCPQGCVPTDADIDRWANVPARLIAQLAAVAVRLNGLDKSLEDASKN